VEDPFTHNPTFIDADARVAKFSRPDGTTVKREYDLLHIVPPQGQLEVIRQSPLGTRMPLGGWRLIPPRRSM